MLKAQGRLEAIEKSLRCQFPSIFHTLFPSVTERACCWEGSTDNNVLSFHYYQIILNRTGRGEARQSRKPRKVSCYQLLLLTNTSVYQLTQEVFVSEHLCPELQRVDCNIPVFSLSTVLACVTSETDVELIDKVSPGQKKIKYISNIVEPLAIILQFLTNHNQFRELFNTSTSMNE